MDLATIIGLVAAFLLMIFGMVFDSNTMSVNFGAVKAFIDVPSLLITFGGAFMATMAMCDSPGEFVKSLKSFTLNFKTVPMNEEETIKSIINLSNIARKEGLLALEEAAGSIEDDFMKKGVLLIVDGTDPELVRSIMETELSCIETRHKGNVGFWENLGSMAFVEIKEEFADRTRASEYLTDKAKDHKIRTDKRLFAKLEDDHGYLAPELNNIFDEWYDNKLRAGVYPQYKGLASAEKEVRKEKG